MGLEPPSLQPLSMSAPTSSSQLVDIGSSATTSTNPTGGSKLPLRTGPTKMPTDAFEGLGSLVGYGGGTSGTNSGGMSTPKRMSMGASTSMILTPPLHLRTGPSGIPAPMGDYLSYHGDRSPRQTPTFKGRSPAPAITTSSDMSVEERFPSIEDYERRSPAPAPSSMLSPTPSMTLKPMAQYNNGAPRNPQHRPSLTPQPSTTTLPKSPGGLGVGSGGFGLGSRSQQTTGTAMKDPEIERRIQSRAGSGFVVGSGVGVGAAGGISIMARRKSLLNLGVGVTEGTTDKKPEAPSLPPRPSLGAGTGAGSKPSAPKDWLTGDDHSVSPPSPHLTSASPSSAYAGAIQRRTSLGGARRTSTYVPSSYTGRSNVTPSKPSNTPARTPTGPPVTLPTVGRRTPANESSDDGVESPEEPAPVAVSSNVPRAGADVGVMGGRFGVTGEGPMTTTSTGLAGRGGTHRKVDSVHDLVDVGNSASGQDTQVADARHKRQSSVQDLIDMTSNPTSVPQPQSRQFTGRAQATSPGQIGEIGQTKRDSESKIAFPSSGKVSPLLASPASQQIGGQRQRQRPQSMFMSSTSSYLNTPGKANSPIAESPSPTSPTPESPRRTRPPRRGSISDIVLRYESLKGGTSTPTTPSSAAMTTSPRTGPPPPVKPIALYARTPASTAAGREKKPALDIPPRSPGANTSGSGWHSRTRTSPTVEKKPTLLPSALDSRPTQPAPTTSSLRMPTPTKPTVKETTTMLRTRTFTPPPPPVIPAEMRRSVSPEKPYQGVASLINQWQKKTEVGDAAVKRVWK
ncbi:hypothetical protein FRB95_007459 [Tulasnella sp. JGI-2019a]|nr:hypothetical protein FRB95_007459 [Tulasnella sp. JGI-2019a]